MHDLAARLSDGAVAALDLAPLDRRVPGLSRLVLRGGATRFAAVVDDTEPIHYVVPVRLVGTTSWGALVLQNTRAGLVWRDQHDQTRALHVLLSPTTGVSRHGVRLDGENWVAFRVDDGESTFDVMVPPTGRLASTLAEHLGRWGAIEQEVGETAVLPAVEPRTPPRGPAGTPPRGPAPRPVPPAPVAPPVAAVPPVEPAAPVPPVEPVRPVPPVEKHPGASERPDDASTMVLPAVAAAGAVDGAAPEGPEPDAASSPQPGPAPSHLAPGPSPDAPTMVLPPVPAKVTDGTGPADADAARPAGASPLDADTDTDHRQPAAVDGTVDVSSPADRTPPPELLWPGVPATAPGHPGPVFEDPAPTMILPAASQPDVSPPAPQPPRPQAQESPPRPVPATSPGRPGRTPASAPAASAAQVEARRTAPSATLVGFLIGLVASLVAGGVWLLVSLLT